MSTLAHLHSLAAQAAVALSDTPLDPIPEDEDVVAGWVAFGFFIGLAVVVALLGVSLTRRLRNADDARRRGVYGDAPEEEPAAADD